jgi:hypothetical protein
MIRDSRLSNTASSEVGSAPYLPLVPLACHSKFLVEQRVAIHEGLVVEQNGDLDTDAGHRLPAVVEVCLVSYQAWGLSIVGEVFVVSLARGPGGFRASDEQYIRPDPGIGIWFKEPQLEGWSTIASVVQRMQAVSSSYVPPSDVGEVEFQEHVDKLL